MSGGGRKARRSRQRLQTKAARKQPKAHNTMAGPGGTFAALEAAMPDSALTSAASVEISTMRGSRRALRQPTAPGRTSKAATYKTPTTRVATMTVAAISSMRP